MSTTDSSGNRDPSDRVARIEHWIDRALKELPPQRAPHSLQARVLATVARRNQAWWHRPFAAWPTPARVAFALCCATLAKLSVDASMWLLSSMPGLGRLESSSFAAWHALAAVHSSLAASIPAPWWYGALTLIAVACGGVFALGTIAYRTLYALR